LPLAGAAVAETYVWVDEDGTTHLTSDPEKVPEAHRRSVVGEGVELGALWGGEIRGEGDEPLVQDSNRPENRTARQLRGAVDDLRQGETARASAALRTIVREQPDNAEALWYLALLERQRGHFENAADLLRDFLAHAGPELDTWRASAREHIAALEDERRLLEKASAPARFLAVKSPNFRVRYDTELARARPDYARTVIRYLEEAHDHLVRQWGVKPEEPTGVVLYGKAAYVLAHSHRFSFDTVGFYDGRIHVVSAAHPAGELRSLLFHEYTHALFREQTGGDRPYWLNEGLAEIAERTSRQEEVLSRSERIRLRDRIRLGTWIPLRRLSPSFAGLAGDDARMAYTESTAAALWILERTDSWDRARLLAALDRGEGQDAALREVVGLDLEGVESALRESILAEFPSAAKPAFGR
jgi:tetratricopeptide (TPR) repeat protein